MSDVAIVVVENLGEWLKNIARLDTRTDAIALLQLQVLRAYRLARDLADAGFVALDEVDNTEYVGHELKGISSDAFITVEAGVALDANGDPLNPLLVEAVQQIEPEIVPLGFTNPIFVDRNGDGYTPPGL